ncbi:MAG: maleylpyruvate isomerase N-terminal domain-containing protein [Spirosomataceae bacterium]
MKKLEPLILVGLLPKIDQKLIELLKSLSDEDWQKQSIAPRWKVKDIAEHLLDGNIRTLSILRDGYVGDPPQNINSYQDFVDYLNKLNADWVAGMKRISPKVLIELLEITGKEYCEYLQTLNPFDDATWSVAWAGEETSQNWFHIAREYTEKWHHQQQIRLAVGKTQELYTREFYLPHLETSMRALPHHYRNTKAVDGSGIQFSITGEGGGDWFLYFENSKWDLVTKLPQSPISKVTIDGEIAWRMFTKGILRDEAQKRVKIEGNPELGNKIFDMLAVMA